MGIGLLSLQIPEAKIGVEFTLAQSYNMPRRVGFCVGTVEVIGGFDQDQKLFGLWECFNPSKLPALLRPMARKIA
ncbi:MAG: hypothetical protein R3B83_02955 [Nitrospirales bacterium]|nr:hypothetical protein [Nitrospirales bacterium]